MAEEFFLDWKVDQPAVLAGKREELYALITVKPNISKLGALLEGNSTKSLAAHVVVIVDVSGSMQYLIRDDPNCKIVGENIVEGKHSTVVETEVPSRAQVAQNVVRQISQMMTANDRMTLIAFDHQAYTLANHQAKGDLLERAVDQLEQVGGGGTSMGRGLQLAFDSIRESKVQGLTQKVIVLTDGEDQEPDFAKSQVQSLTQEFQTPLNAFGTGECNVDFLMNLCQFGKGGAFNDIRNEDEARQFLCAAFDNQKNILATNVRLTLWFSPEIRVKDLYRTKPEILFVGKVDCDAQNSVGIPIEYMEKGKVYEYLFQCELPSRDVGRFRLAKVSMIYDIPAIGIVSERCEANVVVEYTGDLEIAQIRIGDVRRVVSQAEVQRQLCFMQEKLRLLETGQGQEKDRIVVARLLEALIKKFEELGDQMNLNQYKKMREEFIQSGKISQQMMNQSLAASSKVAEATALVEIDDF